MNVKHLLTYALIVPAAVHFSGCATADATRMQSGQAGGSSSTQVTELQQAQQRVASLEQELSMKDQQLAQSRASMPVDTAGSSLFPPNAETGRCYARVLTPARFETTTQPVLVREAATRISVTPAVYETVQERVLIKEASTRLEVIPAVYEEVTERVMISPASEKLV